MKIAIIGAGAMGILFASYLSKDNEILLIDHNKKKINLINKDGLYLVENKGREEKFIIRAHLKEKHKEDVDIVFVFVKSIDNEKALYENRNIIGENTILVSLQNGYGNFDDLLKFQENAYLVLGQTSEASTILKDNRIFHAASGQTYLGLNNNNKRSCILVKNLLERAGFSTDIDKNIEKRIFEKLFINIAINPITALLDVNNSYIYKNPYAKNLAQNLVYEAVSVVNSYGYSFDKKEIFEKVLYVSQKTGDNVSSMRADIINNKESEIDKINGKLVEMAKNKNLQAPFNESICLLIKAKL